MKKGFWATGLVFSFLVAVVFIAGCKSVSGGNDGYPDFKVRVNGVVQDGAVKTKTAAGGFLVDAQAFASKLPGMSFYPLNDPAHPGIVLQYGKRISFASIGFASGFCSAKKVKMDPPIQQEGSVYWTPLNFFAQAVPGQVQRQDSQKVIDVTMPAPVEIGFMLPQAKAVATRLRDNFIVRQGEIALTNPIELFAAGYVQDCNGNNAGANYLITQIPPSPRSNVSYVPPLALQMAQDEAVVWVGYTPPETKYFSYQAFLMTRFYGDQVPVTIKKIYARLADSINSYNFPMANHPFGQFFVMIIANNKDTRDQVEQSVLDAGIARDRILAIVLPDETEPGLKINYGLDVKSDSFNYLHRASLFSREADEDNYVNNPTIEIMRVTPKTELPPNPMTRAVPRNRQTGVREQDTPGLEDMLGDLQAKIIAAHSGNYLYVRPLRTSTWMYPGGDVAISEREDVLGETNDTLYLKTEEFILHQDDLIVVYGVNHDRTGKSVYANVSCYGAEFENGVGGIVSTPWSPDFPGRKSYFGTAQEYLPELDPAEQEMVYAYKFARSPIDESTFVLPYNNDGSFTGFNNGDTVFMGYRMYVNLMTTIGAYPGDVRDGSYFSYIGSPDSEVFFDQAILFTNTP